MASQPGQPGMARCGPAIGRVIAVAGAAVGGNDPADPSGESPADGHPSQAEGEESQDEQPVAVDDDEDPPAARVVAVGATADPVKDYLRQIGKVPLLNAAQEVDLAKRIDWEGRFVPYYWC